MDERRREPGFSTRLVHAGEEGPHSHGAVVLPIYQSAMYAESERVDEQVVYIRYDNVPNHRALAAKMAALEGTESAVVLGSGMAAISATLLTVLRAGDHLLVQDEVYGGTHTLLSTDLPEMGVEVDFVVGDGPDDFERARRENTRAVYVETITNPRLAVADLGGIAEWATEAGLISIIDNTMASPLNFRPQQWGFDLSIHSATKFLNGHSDLVAGIVLGSRARVREVQRKAQRLGGSLDPHACFLLNRGLKTLAVRLPRQQSTAGRVAEFLAEHARVRRVLYPGHPLHPSYASASRHLDGPGSMIAFELEGGAEDVERFLAKLELPRIAPSFGGVESLVTVPARTSHAGLTPAERERRGIHESLIRLSVGLEDADDLLEDLARALEERG